MDGEIPNDFSVMELNLQNTVESDKASVSFVYILSVDLPVEEDTDFLINFEDDFVDFPESALVSRW